MRRKLRFKNKKRKTKSFLRGKRFWYGIFALFCVMFLAYALTFSPWLSLQEVKVEGEREVPKEEIVSLSEEYFWQSFGGIPSKSILFADTSALKEALRQAFPAISGVEVRRSFPRALLIVLQEREQVAVWCQDSSCFAIDEKGVPFKSVQDIQDMVEISSQGSPGVVLGKETVDPELLASLFRFTANFQELSIVSFKIESSTLARSGTKESWEVVLNPAENLDWQMAKLEAVLSQKIPPEKRRLLEYIDLRFGDQAFVKYQN